MAKHTMGKRNEAPGGAEAIQIREGFTARLKATRISAGYRSMADFARALGIEVPTYRRYERGETEPNLWLLCQIRTSTGVPLDYLVAGAITALPVSEKTHKSI